MRRILILPLVAAAVACAPSRSEVVVYWTFGGLSCADAGVATIRVDIAHEVLTPNQFTCAQASQGASLGTYLNGDYQLTVSGLDANGTLAYQSSQTLSVRSGKDNTFPIDVPAVAATSGDVTLHWSFAGRTCAQAGITVVHASVDNTVLTDASDNPNLPCSQSGVDGTTVSPLTPGQHTFDLVGIDASGAARYALNGYTVTAVAGQTAVYNPDLAPAAPTTASANLTWSFDGKSCAAATVDHVTIMVDPDGSGNGGVNAGTVACNTSGIEGASVDGLTEGTHSFAILGIRTLSDGPHLLYRTHNPPSRTFAIGLITDVFVSAESPP
ncbi:MAG TPA: hypothetical protein VFA79_22330 [Myxococcales bacterium]|nr:hypothetical protein [Myxococcales bacterium]